MIYIAIIGLIINIIFTIIIMRIDLKEGCDITLKDLYLFILISLVPFLTVLLSIVFISDIVIFKGSK